MCSVKVLPSSPHVSSDDGLARPSATSGEENSEIRILRMVRADAKVGEEQRFPSRVLAATVRFDGGKYGVNRESNAP
jgi:hypothetical protein